MLPPVANNRPQIPRAPAFHPVAMGAAILLGLLLAGCAYTTKPPFPKDVHTVAVPIFHNESFYQGAEFDLTEALKKEIEAHSPYKVTGDATADTIIRGTLVRVTQATLTQTNTGGLPQELEVQYVVDFAWTNARTGKTLADAKGVMAVGHYVPTQPIGETLATGQQQAAQLMAEKLLAMMRSDW
jgi:hypothetical protein